MAEDLTKTIDNPNIYSFLMSIDKYKFPIDRNKIISIKIFEDYLNSRFRFLSVKLGLDLKEFYYLRQLYTQDLPIINNIELTIFSKPAKDAKASYEQILNFTGMIGLPDNFTKITDAEFAKYELDSKQGNIENNVEVNITLFNKNELTAFNKNYINIIGQSLDVNTLVAYAFDKCSNGKLSFAPINSDNTTKYKQLFMPPLGFYDVLNFIDYQLGGVYESPLNIYIKDEVVFMYPLFRISLKATLPKKYTRNYNIEIVPYSDLGGVGVHVTKNTTDILDFKISDTEVKVTNDFNFLKPSNSYITNDKMNKNTDKYDYYHNIKISNYVAEAINKRNFQIKFLSVKLPAAAVLTDFSPYTEVNVINKDYGGKYGLASNTIVFDRDSADCSVSLYKTY